MLFIFLVQAYSQYIMEGINLLEKGFNFKKDVNFYFPQKCVGEFSMLCNIKKMKFPSEDLQLKKITLSSVKFQITQAQQLLGSFESDEEYHPYYQKTINAYLHEIVFYEEKESLLNVFLDLRKNSTNDVRIINNTYMIDIGNRVVVDITNSTDQRNQSHIYVEVDGINRIQESKQKQEEPSKFKKLFDGFISNNKEVDDVNGKIELSKAMYIKELYAKTNGKEALIEFRLNDTVSQINHLKQDQRLQLIKGPLGQLVDNIRISDNLQIGVVHFKTDKIKLTHEQQFQVIIERFATIYRAIHHEHHKHVYDANVKVLLDFIDKILLKIKQQDISAESPDQILEIIKQIENEMSNKELQQLKDIIEFFTSSELTASDITNLQLKLKQISEND